MGNPDQVLYYGPPHALDSDRARDEDGRVPLYDYTCPSCDELFEVLCRSDAPAPGCPSCASELTVRCVSSFATPNARGGKRALVAAPGSSGGSCGAGGCCH